MTSLDLCQAVIFDMDGLMLDTETIARQAFHDAAEELGLSIPAEIYNQMIGKNTKSSRELLFDNYGPEFPYDQLHETMSRNEETHIKVHGISTKPGLLDLLDLLDQYSFPKAVGTSTRKEVALKRLQTAQIRDRFDQMAFGDEVTHAKPAPDLFLKVAHRLNQLPENCLILEDSEPGIQAGSAAGMIPIMIPDLIQPSPGTRDLAYKVVNSLQAVFELLKPILENR